MADPLAFGTPVRIVSGDGEGMIGRIVGRSWDGVDVEGYSVGFEAPPGAMTVVDPDEIVEVRLCAACDRPTPDLDRRYCVDCEEVPVCLWRVSFRVRETDSVPSPGDVILDEIVSGRSALEAERYLVPKLTDQCYRVQAEGDVPLAARRFADRLH